MNNDSIATTSPFEKICKALEIKYCKLECIYPALEPSARSSIAQRVPSATTLSTCGSNEIWITSSGSHNCRDPNMKSTFRDALVMMSKAWDLGEIKHQAWSF